MNPGARFSAWLLLFAAAGGCATPHRVRAEKLLADGSFVEACRELNRMKLSDQLKPDAAKLFGAIKAHVARQIRWTLEVEPLSADELTARLGGPLEGYGKDAVLLRMRVAALSSTPPDAKVNLTPVTHSSWLYRLGNEAQALSATASQCTDDPTFARDLARAGQKVWDDVTGPFRFLLRVVDAVANPHRFFTQPHGRRESAPSLPPCDRQLVAARARAWELIARLRQFETRSLNTLEVDHQASEWLSPPAESKIDFLFLYSVLFPKREGQPECALIGISEKLSFGTPADLLARGKQSFSMQPEP